MSARCPSVDRATVIYDGRMLSEDTSWGLLADPMMRHLCLRDSVAMHRPAASAAQACRAICGVEADK